MFVVIEGIDGAGKTTVAEALRARLASFSRVVKSSYPRYLETPQGNVISRYLTGEFGPPAHPYLHGLLYATDRFVTRKDLETKLVEYDHVVVDRYVSSNLAYLYAMAKPEEREEVIRHFVWLEYGEYAAVAPDAVFVLDVPTDIASRNRRKYRTNDDILESDQELIDKARSFYRNDLRRVHPESSRIVTLDCVRDGVLRSVEDIVDEIVTEMCKIESEHN